jgi:ATP-binding cassette, subfamily F, member 3
MPIIDVAHVSKHFGAELILDDVSLRLERGDHAALVGTNGAGKSTLLRIMAGLEEPDAGNVHTARGVTVGYLEQEPSFEAERTLFDVMLDVFRPVIDAQRRLRDLEAGMAGSTADEGTLAEYSRLQELVEHVGYDYSERIERVLLGLDLPADLWESPIGSLSGGQRTRASLARTLLEDADVLLLDEPTNHLDIPAVEWLEGYLRDSKRTFLIVSHDRYVLDRVSTKTFEVSFHRLTPYDAPYSRYLELRAERAERQRLEYETQQEEIGRTEEFIRRYGAGQRYKEARGRQKRLDRLERVERPREEGSIGLNLGKVRRSGEIVLQMLHLEVGYERHALVRLPDEVIVRRADRIAIIGPNGSGKTTLVRTIVGELPPVAGSVRWGSRTTRGYYSQTLGQLREDRTVLEEIQDARAMSEEEARNLLGRFLFSGDDAFKEIRSLSGGERSRVALARLILQAPNVLVLDEPTNHLDIASRDALEQVLSAFEGTLLFVSHDRYLIDQLAGQLWVIGDGRMRQFVGGYSDYAAGRAKPLRAERARGQVQRETGGTPRERVARLDAEAIELAAEVADIARTGSLAHIEDLMTRYANVVAELGEADRQWSESVRKAAGMSSA